MTTIKSFDLGSNTTKTVTIRMPMAYGILSVQMGKSNPVLWIRADDDAAVMERTFRFVRENETVELDEKNYMFIGALVLHNNEYIHIFEVR